MNPVLAIHEATKGAEKQRRFYEPELTFSAFVPSSRFFVFTSFPIATPTWFRAVAHSFPAFCSLHL
jgi:hypothetical protein